MKIQVLSDLHLEFAPLEIPDVGADVVVLAGDIDIGLKGVRFAIDKLAGRRVIYVAGNHEYYGKAIPHLTDKLRHESAGSTVHFLEARIAAQDAVIAAKDARIAELEKQVTELLERLHRNSDNSNKPPSSDAPSTRAERRAKNKNKSGRKRGGQPGHEGSQRALVPPDQVDDVADHSPTECENCWAALPETPDPSAQRYQTTELPPTKLFIRR
jgi:hypothetical protein